MNAVIKFFNLPRSEKLIIPEVFFRLMQVRLILWLIPFKRIAPGLGEHMHETSSADQPQYKEEVLRVRQTLRRLSKRMPWKNTCLVQAVAGKKMLQRRCIPSTLYLGVAKEKEKEVNQSLKAHAWLRSGKIMITGAKGVNLSNYTVVSMFGEFQE